MEKHIELKALERSRDTSTLKLLALTLLLIRSVIPSNINEVLYPLRHEQKCHSVSPSKIAHAPTDSAFTTSCLNELEGEERECQKYAFINIFQWRWSTRKKTEDVGDVGGIMECGYRYQLRVWSNFSCWTTIRLKFKRTLNFQQALASV
ncbi:uncharacterized protein LOC119609214 [Lucilia sericata]|uniref:uncharacterized protein LOC119609214 n=1 Tax=Lucilia sericata TaxID=13632 RepID=UPI0018A80B49|nr:uncharacterized protein LOC119609214 [Lucilia sericata]